MAWAMWPTLRFLPRSSNRTCRFPASGFPTSFIVACQRICRVMQASKFELVVNAETARMLGTQCAAVAARHRRRGHRITILFAAPHRVRKWHDSDLPRCLPYGRYLVISGH